MSMTVLYPIVEDVTKERSLEVDIVAVHGVGGHPLGTWSWTPNANHSQLDPKAASKVVTTKVKDSEKTLWLQDFLPFDFPTARVMTFGYDGEALPKSSTPITDHAKALLSSLMGMRSRDFEQQRPIIFLAHSLGGLVVKQALLYAHNDGQFRTLEESTIGVMFFGTPHRGSEQTTYRDLLGKMASMTIKPNTSLMKVLQRDSDTLARLSLESRRQLSRYKVVSLYETHRTALGLFSSLIPDKHSAVLDAPWESQIAVDANHKNMCKFSSREDVTYQHCRISIKEFLKDRAEPRREASSGKVQTQHYMIPHDVTRNYIGREDIGRMLAEKCLPSQITNVFNKCCVLVGLGGIGKTQVCLKFAQDYREMFWGIFWINASTEASIQQSLLDIVRELRLEEDVLLVKRYLSETTKSWLLILDNADDPSINLSKYFPTGAKGSILITSRDFHIKVHATVGSIEIRYLEQEDAIKLLLRAAADPVNSDAAAYESAKSIIELLGGLPLAIHQAGAYIRQTHCTMEEYVEAYHNRRELLQRDYNDKGTSSHDPAESFEVVFDLSFQSIEGMGTEVSRDALDLLCFLSFVSCEINAEELIKRAWNNATKHTRSSRYSNYQLRVLYDPPKSYWDPYRLRIALEILASFSLVTLERDGNTVSSHPMVHRAVHDRLSKDELSRYSHVTASTLASAAGPNFGFGFREALLSHLSSFLRLHNDDLAIDIDPLNSAESLSFFATAYSSSGQYGRALELETRASKVRETLLGGEHPDTMRSMSRIGRCLHVLQRPSEAAAVNERVLQLRQVVLGDDHVETLESIECLARSYHMLGQLQQATSLMEKALELRLRLYGTDHTTTITNMSHLAAYYRESGRYSDAVELEEKVLGLRLRVFGKEHPATLNSMNNLAVTYGKLGRLQEATELSKNVLALSKKVLGDRHSESVTSMHNLAAIYSMLGQHTEAVHLEVQVLNLRREQLGKMHPDTLQAMASLATAYNAINQHGECLQLRQELMQQSEAKFGRDHPATWTSMADLATSNENTGQYQYAIGLRERLLRLTEAQFDRGHPATLEKMADLATSYEITGSQQEAAELRESLQQTKKSIRGDEQADPSTATRNVPVSSPTVSDTENYSSDDDFTYSEESAFSQASSDTSSGSVRANAIERLAVTFENDLELLFAYEDLMLIMSRRKFIHAHMRLLKTYFADLQPTTVEQRQAVSFLSRRRQRRLVAEEICNRTSTNRTLKEPSDDLLTFNRLQLPDISDRQPTISSIEEVERDDFAHGHPSSDESEDSGKEFSREHDVIRASEADGLLDLLTEDVSYSQYKHGLQDFAHRHCSPGILRSVMRTGNVEAVRGVIERHFDAVAAKEFEWLWELKSLGHSYYDIAELLLDDTNESPWIFLNQPQPQEVSIRPDFHAPSCVHQGGKKHSLGPRLVMADIENTEDLKKLVAEHCGLAGVVPKSRDPKAWTGLVTFSGERQSTASITYDIPGSRHRLVSRVRETIQRFCGTVTYLQRKGLCCTSFTVLRYTSVNGYTAIEVRPVSFRLASDLFVVLQLLENNWDSPGLISRCLPRLNELANEVTYTICNTIISGNKDDLDFHSCLNDVSLAVQILTLGLYLYSQAHTGTVHPFFLMNPLSKIHLLGTQSPLHQSAKARIRISLARLTCMAEMTGDLVTVFGSHESSEAQSVEQAYDLLASPEDLAQTWDVWRLIMDTTTPYGENIYAIEVGEGFISSAGESHEWRELGKAIPKLHWSRGAQATEFKTPFSLRLKALIGTTTVNTQCPVDEHQSWLSANIGMDTLGVKESYWERSEAQAGLQAGHYVVAQFNVTWIKRPGTTLKHIHLRPDINLPFLQSDWGLQISYCTSVARRVSLCELLADVTPILVEALLQKPLGWQSLQADYNFVDALRGGGFKDWFGRLNAELQSDVLRIVRYVLLVLQDTGIDRSGDHLVAVWPRKSNPLGCFKIPCKDATFWARMLKDSPDCATFAYVSPLCLETNDWKCQRLETAPWHNRSVVLNTAVSRHLKNGIATAGPWRLRHEQTYLIGQPENYLLGKVSIPMSPATIHIPPHLYVSSSMIPAFVQSRIKERLREKQCTDAPALGVVVLAKQPHSLLLDGSLMSTR